MMLFNGDLVYFVIDVAGLSLYYVKARRSAD